jgi:hypothetical protein
MTSPDVIDVSLGVSTDLLMEATLHAALVSSPHILQPKQHGDVAVCFDHGDE